MPKLDNILDRTVESPQAKERLAQLLTDGTTTEFSLEYLYDRVEPDSLSSLTETIAALVDEDVLELVIRVVSPESGAGLSDYRSFQELPRSVFDEVDTGEQVPVTRSNIEILYRIK